MKKLRRLVGCVVFTIMLVGVLLKVDQIMERKYSYSKYADFYDQKEDFDVLFFGTSHMLNAVFPMELWNDYGIVSYNMANYSETIATNYWQLVNALNYTTPKVVIVDLYALDAQNKYNGSSLHNFTDSIPLSILKLRTVADLLPKEMWAEYLFELSLYHSRWEELEKEDILPQKTVEKGAELRYEVEVDSKPVIIEKERYEDNNREGKEYLHKMIDLCKEKGIAIILTYLPYSAPESHQMIANSGYIIAQENDIPYLNFFYEDLEMNYVTDCADTGSHLNASGAKKVTDYFGSYLRNNYNIPDRREENAYEYWNNDYEEYMDFKVEQINESDDNIMSYLMLLNDKNLETTISLTEDSLVYQDKDIMELLDNISVFGSLTYHFLPDNYYEGNIMFEVRDVKTQQIVSQKNFSRVEENVYDTY